MTNINKYIKKQMALINSLPSDHFIHSIIVTNGMRHDLAKHPVFHEAMIELLSSGFTVKMNGIGTGTFIATKSKFEFVLIHGKHNIVCVVWMKGKQIFEFNAEKKAFYNFEVDRGSLNYDGLHLASAQAKFEYVNTTNIDKFLKGVKK